MKKAILVTLVMAGLFFALFVCFQMWGCEGTALAGEPVNGQPQQKVALEDVLVEMQPRLTEDAVDAYARAFRKAGTESEVRPALVAVIAFRESSFFPAIAECRQLGSLGELGIMQVMPRGRALRYAPDGCRDQCRAGCSIRTGAAYLAACRDWCPGSTWRWVAAYGRRRCPTEAEAREDRATKRAKRIWDSVVGGEW
jgi:hypothetical protein